MFDTAVIVLAFVISLSLTAVVRRYALKTGMMDVPNPRSSHMTPTPRGGGIAIVVAVCFTSAGLFALGLSDWRPVAVCFVPGAMVALVGYMDDRLNVAARIRILVHIVAAIVTVILTWPWPGLTVMNGGIQALSALAVIFGICWMINLYNFMDGIDGLSASEAMFVFGSAAVLVWLGSEDSHWVALLGAAASGAAGFLWWNSAPARIFMGDVGSGFIGLLISGFALLTWKEGLLPLATWMIVVSLFVADASVTLVRRMIRGDRWYSAHRSHAYQRLARSTLGHAGVVRLSWAWNLLVLAPAAYWSVRMPEYRFVLAAFAMSASIALVLISGAGRPEQDQQSRASFR